MGKIFIYADEGTGPQCLSQTERMLRRFSDWEVERLGADEVIRGSWRTEARLFVMPGGADLPYHRLLSGRGNAEIKGFVQEGGSYLGICAGSYFGGSEIVFSKGTAAAIAGSRELSFFPGVVEGPTFGPFDNDNYVGARAAKIITQGRHLHFFYFGGGHFVDASLYPGVEVMARYGEAAGHPAAIVHCSVGNGNAILSGVHIEFEADGLNRPDLKQTALLLDETQEARRLFLENLFSRLGIPKRSN